MLTCQRNKFHEHVPAKHKHILSSWISESFLSASFSWNEIPKQFCLSLKSLKWIISFLSSAGSPERKAVETTALGCRGAQDDDGEPPAGSRRALCGHSSPCDTCAVGREGVMRNESCPGCLENHSSPARVQAHKTQREAVSVSRRLRIIWLTVAWMWGIPAEQVKWQAYPGKKSGVLLPFYVRICSQFRRKKN